MAVTHQIESSFKEVEMIKKKKKASTDMTPKAKATKVKIYKVDYIKIKSFYMSKDTIE